jgi:hypothetical protein
MYSTITTQSVSYSTLTGSSIVSNVVTGSVIGGNAMTVSTLTANIMTTSTLTTTGNVGINYNINSPNYKLVIEQGFGNSSNGLFISNTNYGSMQGFGLSMVYNGFYSYATIQGYTSGVAAVVPLCLQPTSGNVGIGTNAPSAPLHVYASTSIYTAGTLTVTNTNTIPAVSAAIIAPNMSLTGASGNLFAIGQATTQYNSMVMGWFSVGAGSTSNYLNINGYSNPTAGTGLNITAGGNVGIGITNPGSLLTINGNANIMGSLFTSSSVLNAYSSINPYNLTVTYPAIYLLSVTSAASTNGGSTNNLSGLVYILLNASGSMNTYAVIVNGGVSVNSFTPNTTTPSNSTINISLGYNPITINGGNTANVNLLRIN